MMPENRMTAPRALYGSGGSDSMLGDAPTDGVTLTLNNERQDASAANYKTHCYHQPEPNDLLSSE
jgi:hypothetical protein